MKKKNTMKKVLSLMLACIMVLSLVACGGGNAGGNETTAPAQGNQPTDAGNAGNAGGSEVKYAESITIGLPQGLTFLDPHEGWTWADDTYWDRVFEGLVSYDGVTGEVKPWLAETAEWTDDTYTRIHIVLRDDVYFSNGDKLTTADVEFSMERMTRDALKSVYAGCEVVDEKEMYINLTKPCGDWLGGLGVSFAAIVCKSATEADPEGRATIGTGPYVYDLDSYVVENKITLNANENYWGEKPITKQLNYVVIADASARGVALANGEVDLTYSLNTNELPIYQANEDLVVTAYPSTSFFTIAFNDKRDSNNISEGELNLRRAIACAINREELIAAYGQTGASPMISMWRTDAAYIADESEYDTDLSYNPEKAKEYLAKADRTEIDCVVNAAVCKVAAQVVQEQLRKVGITMNIIESDNAGVVALFNAVEEPTYDMVMYGNMITYLPCAGWVFWTHMGGANACSQYDPEIQAALEVVMTTGDLDEKIEALQIIQKENHENVGWLPLFWREGNYACAKGVEGFVVESSGVTHLDNIVRVVE